jgi:hypothetical protein
MTRSTSKELTPLEQLQIDVQRYRTNTLQNLRRDARNQQNRLRQEALSALERAERESHIPENSRAALAQAILATVREIVTPVIASFDLNPTLQMRVNDSWSQHWLKVTTNYLAIDVEMSSHGLPSSIPEAADIARIMTTVKALVYHEMGHLLYSIPFGELLELARSQGASVPMASTEPSVEDLTPLYGWGYAVLDDQRMECALVHASPVFADYLTTSTAAMIIDVAAQTDAVGDIWPMVCGRSFMPAEMLADLRCEAVAFARLHGLEDDLAIIEREVVEFKRATTERGIFEALDRVLPALSRWFHGRRTYTALQYSSHEASRPRYVTADWILKDLCPLPNPESSATESSPPADGESQASGRGDTPASIDTTSRRRRSRSGGVGSASALDQATSGRKQYLDQELAQALTPIGEIQQAMAVYRDARVRQLFREFQFRPMVEAESSRAQTVRREMLDLLVPLTSQADPSWRFRQEDGVLDPVSYAMREPGDTDYWSSLDEYGSPGPNLAVSLVLDVSYSMQSDVADLFVAAIGVRLACDELDLPCTVSTFADESRVLFEAEDPTQEVIGRCHGGTNPVGALTDLVNQREGKKQQLVIVFTDGVWATVETIDPYRAPETVIIGVTLDRGTAKDLAQRGFDEVVVIDSIIEFASAVMAALVPYYA